MLVSIIAIWIGLVFAVAGVCDDQTSKQSSTQASNTKTKLTRFIEHSKTALKSLEIQLISETAPDSKNRKMSAFVRFSVRPEAGRARSAALHESLLPEGFEPPTLGSEDTFH